MPPPAQIPHPAVALMARETQLREGPVSCEIGGITVGLGKQWLHEDSFVLRTPGDLRFAYRKDEGVTVQRPADCDPAEEYLWLNGSVYAAIACINGLYPIHASAVALGGRVFAFTGPSGAGKSTLVAELTRRGLPLFCDDTLIVDLSDPGRVVCLPGHKRLKLWPDALELTGAAPDEQVMASIPKFYAQPAGESVADVLPLAELCFLEEGEPARIEPLQGGEKLVRLQDDHYTAELFLAASRPDRIARFAQLAGLARAINLTRFVRPRDRARFALDAGLAESHVKTQV